MKQWDFGPELMAGLLAKYTEDMATSKENLQTDKNPAPPPQGKDAPKYYTTPESAAAIKKEEDEKQNKLNSPLKHTPPPAE